MDKKKQKEIKKSQEGTFKTNDQILIYLFEYMNIFFISFFFHFT